MTHLLLGLALAVAAPGPKDKEKDKTPQKLDGAWVVDRIEGKGDKKEGDVTFTFADGKISIREGAKDRKEDADYTVDATKKPAHIDIKPGKGQDVVGIYEIDGDTLKLCFSAGGARPTEFKADEGSRTILVVLKRSKDK